MKKNYENYTILGNVNTTEEMFEWYNFLTSGDKVREQEFAKLYDETSDVFSSVMQYRRERIAQSEQIQLTTDNPIQFRKQLQEMFWEPVGEGYFKAIVEVMEKNGWNATDLIKAHNQEPQKRIWRIVSLPNIYIAC